MYKIVPASKDTQRLLHLTRLFIALVAAIVRGDLCSFQVPQWAWHSKYVHLAFLDWHVHYLLMWYSAITINFIDHLQIYEDLYTEHTSIYVLVELWPPCSDCINLAPKRWKVCWFSPCEWPEVFFNITLVQESIKRSPCVIRIVAFWPCVPKILYHWLC